MWTFNEDRSGKYSCSNRVVNEWNAPSEDKIKCNTLAGFKEFVDHHLGLIRRFT